MTLATCAYVTEHEVEHCTMSKIYLSFRGAVLTLLILATLGRAHLDQSLVTAHLSFPGLGRLGRDLVRRATSEEIALPADLMDPLLGVRIG
jgi:hypothetical protein